MADLQSTFYIIGITFMGLLLLITVVIVVAVLVIRARIIAIQRHIEEKFANATGWAQKGGAVIGALKKASGKTKK